MEWLQCHLTRGIIVLSGMLNYPTVRPAPTYTENNRGNCQGTALSRDSSRHHIPSNKCLDSGEIVNRKPHVTLSGLFNPTAWSDVEMVVTQWHLQKSPANRLWRQSPYLRGWTGNGTN